MAVVAVSTGDFFSSVVLGVFKIWKEEEGRKKGIRRKEGGRKEGGRREEEGGRWMPSMAVVAVSTGDFFSSVLLGGLEFGGREQTWKKKEEGKEGKEGKKKEKRKEEEEGGKKLTWGLRRYAVRSQACCLPNEWWYTRQ
jgi:hypothetical protein